MVLHGGGAEGDQDIRLSLEDRGVAKQTEPGDVDPAVLYDDWSGPAKLLPAKVPGLHPLLARTAMSRTPRTPGAPFVLGSPAGDPRLVGVAGGSGARAPALHREGDRCARTP